MEATSVTPFSPRALGRGLVAVVTALVRHLHPGLFMAFSIDDKVRLRDQPDKHRHG